MTIATPRWTSVHQRQCEAGYPASYEERQSRHEEIVAAAKADAKAAVDSLVEAAWDRLPRGGGANGALLLEGLPRLRQDGARRGALRRTRWGV